MSGGRLVVLDRLGRDAKAYTLAEGSASIGSDPSCDIRVILPGVRPHHATVTVHASRTLVRAVAGETLLNGATVSVAALRHGDTLQLGGRALRWDYGRPPPPSAAVAAASPCLAVPRRGAAARARRRSEPARRALHAPGRDSAPASTSTSGKQVAIVQPQRRDTSDRNAESPSGSFASASPAPPTASARKSFPSKTPKPLLADDPTKASLWIESRKTRASPQLLVQSARNSSRNGFNLTTESPRISRKRSLNVSTECPKNLSTILRASDISRERATVSPRDVSPGPVSPRGVSPGPLSVSPRVSLRGAAKSAPLRLAVLKKAHSAQSRVTKIRAPLKIDHTKQAAILLMTGHAARPRSVGPPARSSPARRAPARASAPGRPSGRASASGQASFSGSPLQIKYDDNKTPFGGHRSSRHTLQSPGLPRPKKSALKDPTAKKSTRKTESIKFDLSNLSTLSNLESYDQSIASEVADSSEDLQNMSDEDINLHYSDNSSAKSSSPMKTVHSRSSLIIEKSLGSPMQTPTFEKSTLNVQSPRSKKSLRGTIIVQRALNNSNSRYSRRTTKSLSDQSYSTTITSRISEPPSQRSSQNLEAYSIVDLVSENSNESGRSVYNSVDSNSTASFGTPGTIRKTRSKGSLLGSSTPYSKKTLSPKIYSSETTNHSASKKSRLSTRRSASLTTSENIPCSSFNSTKMSRSSRNMSRITDSDVLLVDEDENEDLSPRSSRQTSKNLLSPVRKNISIAMSPSDGPTNGTITPENMCSPLDVGTPMLSIQSLLDQSSVSQTSRPSQNSRNTRRSIVTRKSISSIFSEPKTSRLSAKCRSLNLTGRRSLRARRTRSDSLNGKDQSQDTDDDPVTPKSAVKLVQEAVKNKHSTAKKPQSKRSLIDNLDDSDFVKELFNSPVKRKLSQSMTEFSRKFFDDDVIKPPRPTRNTVALTGRTPDNSLLNNTQEFTPEMFVSPLSTPSNSPNLSGLKRILRKNTPENDLRNISGVKTLLRTPRARKSINNDLSNISGVKKLFGKSPRNRLSDVRVKELFAISPTADFGRVSGVKALFHRSPLNDLRNISGLKRVLRVNTPRNNLTDFRGVKRLFREQYNENNSSDVSGVEDLRDESPSRPHPRVHSKSNGCVGGDGSKKGRRARGTRSLRDSIGVNADNVEEWLQDGLKKRVQIPVPESDSSKSTSGSNATRELRKRRTDTVEGHTPPPASRSDDGRKRSASEIYSARKLPLKKRSLASPRRSRDAALPLKKRALPQPALQSAPHSTPLRPAARGLSMNASELARVSPISAVAPGISPPSDVSKPRATKEDRRPRALTDDVEVIVSAKPSPRRTRGGLMRSSPARVPPRAARGRKTNFIEAALTGQKSQNKVSPKKTRAKVLKDTVVVSKPSPQIKLRSKRQIKERTESIQIEKVKRTRNATNDNIKGAKTRKTKQIAEVQQTEEIEPLKPKRGRKIAVVIEAISVEDVPVKKRGRKAREIQNVIETQKTRSRKIAVEPEPNKISRGKKDKIVGQRKLAIAATSPVKLVKTKIVDKVIRKSRRGAVDIEDTSNTKKAVVNPDKKTRASKKNVTGSVEVVLKTDGRKTKKTIAKEESKATKTKKVAPARALRKRPAPDPVEDTAVETKKRRTRRAVV